MAPIYDADHDADIAIVRSELIERVLDVVGRRHVAAAATSRNRADRRSQQNPRDEKLGHHFGNDSPSRRVTAARSGAPALALLLRNEAQCQTVDAVTQV